jgi:cell division protein FtsZ
MGLAMMGTGIASGESRAREAAMKAITSPLLEDVSIEGAKGVLMNVSCGPDLTIDEVSEAANFIHEAAHEDAKIYFGCVFDQDIGDELRVTVIATGIEAEEEEKTEDRAQQNVTPISRKRQEAPAEAQRPRKANLRPDEQEDLRIPAYIRQQNRGGEGQQKTSKKKTVTKKNSNGEEFIFDEDEFEIPSFIRMQAD